MPAQLAHQDHQDHPDHVRLFRNLDWEKAKTFYYVGKHGNFTSAGQFLNISQSALSRQVIFLEQQLGYPLFSRSPRGVKLTRKGEELFAVVEATFIGLKKFTYNNHVKMANGRKRKIRIATTHALAAYIFNNLILDYNVQHPGLIFEIIENDRLIDILINDVDIAIRPYDQVAKGLHQEPLFTLEKKLYASSEYLKKYGKPQTVADLKDHRLLAFGRPNIYPYANINWILQLGMPQGKLHEPTFISTSIECLIESAKRGIGIIANYEKLTIIRDANLKHILPEATYKEEDAYFMCPDYLKKDKEIMQLKEHFLKYLAS